jgi:hypothetical protein
MRSSTPAPRTLRPLRISNTSGWDWPGQSRNLVLAHAKVLEQSVERADVPGGQRGAYVIVVEEHGVEEIQRRSPPWHPAGRIHRQNVTAG